MLFPLDRMPSKKPAVTRRTCPRGHSYRKSSDCPTCPVCESERRPEFGLLAQLSAPARRAFERAGIASVTDLATWRERDILALHGVGPSTIPKLNRALDAAGKSFRA